MEGKLPTFSSLQNLTSLSFSGYFRYELYSVNSITASVNVFFGNPEYKYSEAELAEYTLMMKRAFKNGTYFINCDYGSAGVQVGDYHKKIGYDAIMTSYPYHNTYT